ncbi:MAG: HEAT repeat domain-containing protein [Treponema sp.]|jgi:HEAT repeat protein|nr:HEAT repeat domain-containing protein [Treponema sp.]
MKVKLIFLFFIAVFFVHAQDIEPSRLATLKYGTENEIAALIQSLKNENADYLDNELITLIDNTRNQKIMNGVFSFFGGREKAGLEDRAIRAVEERDEEATETVLSAMDYLGKLKSAKAVPSLMELLNSQEKKFMNNAFRALGRASSSDSQLADETAEYLVDYFSNRDPGDDNRREVITSLGATGSAKGVPLLIDIVSNTDERVPLRIAALDAISKLGSQSGQDGLDAVLACVSTNDPNVRSAAVAALGPFSGEEVDKVILDAFRDSYYRTRAAAAQASRERKLVAAVPYLKFRAERDEVPNIRDDSIRALGAIANDEAIGILENLFSDRKNSDRVRLASGEMLMKNAAVNANYLSRVIVELDEAKRKNQTALYNGFLKIIGETRLESGAQDLENVARRLLAGGVIEKLYGLDIAANNGLKGLETEVKAQMNEKNESIARKARQTAEKLGIEI